MTDTNVKQYTFPDLDIDLKHIKTKEQAWKLLALSKPVFTKSSKEHISLLGMYTKEHLEAILLLWDELGDNNERI